MKIGLICLVAAYMLSQFYRAFLAVLAPALEADLGTTPEDLSYASGLWFLVFAAMQIPVGEALDRVGPRLTAAGLFGLGGAGGAAVFALAQGPGGVTAAMILLGIGCSPVLMASYYIFARVYPAAVFATLAGTVLGLGSLGNLASSAPLAWAAGALGWRGTMWALAGLTLAIAALLWLTVQNPPRVQTARRGSVLDLLRIPALWLILPMMLVNYAPAAGLRGLWAGPYADQVFGADAAMIGRVTLVMGIAMIAGNLIYGPLDRLLGTRKWTVFGGNMLVVAACLALWALPGQSLVLSTLLLAAVGFFGASFPVLIAHGRAFFPDHLAGRGVTLMNLFGIAGVGIMQIVSGRLYRAVDAGGDPTAPFTGIFAVYAGLVAAGLILYAFARDRTD
ncbi:MAG: Arabinose efflux permease [Rhodobacteraceae bacterium HLUCCA08]|nr:MAG: Arabinose efflux permease [Rhodobacteraceae bacterium HLUCCA08]